MKILFLALVVAALAVAQGASAKPKAAKPDATKAPAASTVKAALIDINSATAEQLQAMPGIGPVMPETSSRAAVIVERTSSFRKR